MKNFKNPKVKALTERIMAETIKILNERKQEALSTEQYNAVYEAIQIWLKNNV